MFIKILSVLLLLSSPFLFAQSISLHDTIPVDTSFTLGKLANGMTYIIRKNTNPKEKVEMRLIVRVGSIVEDSSEQGLAHFLEHMAFNGTKNFKKNELISYLQSIGVRFGPDLNAYTGFEETVYMLPIPLNNYKNIDKGFQILQDWASGMTLNEKDIEAEKKIILEEERLSKGAEERMRKKILPGIFAYSLYADRLPIGKDSIINYANHKQMMRFYKKWYRPELMSLIVVGDVDPKDIETKIKKYFGKLKNPPSAHQPIYPEIKPYQKISGVIATDSEATANSVLINFSAQERKPQLLWKDYQRDVIKNIFLLILNQRFSNNIHTDNPPYLYADFSISNNTIKYENPLLTVTLGADMDLKKGVSMALEEWNRIKKIGVYASELERAKNNMEVFYKNAYAEKNNTETSVYAEEYTRFFIEQEPSPGIDAEYHFVKKILPKISIKTVNDYINTFQDTAAFIALVGTSTLKEIKMDTVVQWISDIQKSQLDTLVEEPLPTVILEEIPTEGRIVKEETDDRLGTTELWLSNGIRVTLKKTDFKDDEILIQGLRRGGKSQYIKTDLENTTYLNAITNAMGVGKFSSDVWRKMNAGRLFSVSFSINDITDNWIASSTQKDLVYCFQSIYLMGTTIPQDTIGFKSFMSQLRNSLSMVKNNPQLSFFDTMVKVFYNNNPYTDIVIPTEQQLDKVSLSRLLEIYHSRANNFDKMHFVIVGSFDEVIIKKLLVTYIASLPTSEEDIDFMDLNIRPIKGKNNFDYYKSTNNRSMVYYRLYKEFPYSEDLNLKMKLLEKIFNIRLLQGLREETQGAYTLNVSTEFEKYPYSNSNFSFVVPCAPENALRLWKMIQINILDILQNGSTEEELLKAKQEMLQQHKENLSKNKFWLDQLANNVFPQDNIDYAIHLDRYLQNVKIRDIQRAAQLLLNSNVNSFRAIWYPERASKKK